MFRSLIRVFFLIPFFFSSTYGRTTSIGEISEKLDFSFYINNYFEIPIDTFNNQSYDKKFYHNDKYGQLLSDNYIRDTKNKFLQEVSYETERKKIKLVQFLFEQWRYVETYKVFRTAYLMVNFLRTFQYLDSSQNDELLNKFDSLAPSNLLVKYPFLERLKFSIQSEIKKKRTKEFIGDNLDRKAGQIATYYLLLRLIEAKKNFLKERFPEDSHHYANQMSELLLSEAYLKQSAPILFTDTLQNKVEPYYKKELDDLYNFTKKQIYEISEKIADMHTKKNVENLPKDEDEDEGIFNRLLSSEKLQNIMEAQELKKVLSSRIIVQFTNRIRKALPEAYEEILNYQEEVFESNKEMIAFDFIPTISKLIFETEALHTEEIEKLKRISLEEPIRLQIVRDYPELRKIDSFITNKNWRFSQDEKYSNFLYLVGAFGLSIGFAGKKIAKRFFDWVNPIVLSSLRGALFLGVAGFSYQFAYQSFYKSYLDYKRNMDLARSSVDQRGLLTIMEAESKGFYENLIIATVLSSIQLIILATMARSLNFPFLSFMRTSQSQTAIPKQHKIKEYFKKLSRELKQTFFGQKKGSYIFNSYKIPPSSVKNFQRMKVTQTHKIQEFFIKMMDVYMKPVLKIPLAFTGSIYYKTLGRNLFKEKLFYAFFMGMVFILMSSVQSSMVTPIYRKVFDILEYIGVDVPPYIKKQLVNVFNDIERMAFTNAAVYLTQDRVNIGHELRSIDEKRKQLEDSNLTDDQKHILREKIAKSETSIQSILKVRIYFWVNYREYRNDLERFFEAHGFKLSFSPSKDNYDTIQLIYSPKGYDSYNVSLKKEEAEVVDLTGESSGELDVVSMGGVTLEELLGEFFGKLLENKK